MDIVQGSQNSWFKRRFALAICVAERGWMELYSGRIARNNPGDLKDETGIVHTYQNVIDGWDALLAEIDLIQQGKSKHYTMDLTIEQFAMVWTGNDNPMAWASIVAGMMGASIRTPLMLLE